MNYDNYRHLRIERRQRVLTLTLDRPPMNPIHFDLHNELSRIFYEVHMRTSRWFSAAGAVLPGIRRWVQSLLASIAHITDATCDCCG